MLSNCGARGDSWESLGLQGDPVDHKRNHSWIVIRRTDAKAEAPILWPPDVKSQFMWKRLTLGKIEGKRRRGWEWMRWLNSITNSMDMNLSKLWEIVNDRGTWCAEVHGVTKNPTWLRGWTTTKEVRVRIWIQPA